MFTPELQRHFRAIFRRLWGQSLIESLLADAWANETMEVTYEDL
jgi:hypothetical protein